MSLPTMTGIGRALDDPELRFAPSGVAVCRLRLAFNSRRKDEATGQWSDDKTFYVDATAFKQMAENIAESVRRGTEVIVTGRLVTDQWEDKNGGGKRSKPSLLIDSIGPSLQFASASVNKMARSGGQQPAAGNGGGGFTDDPWATAGAPAGGGRQSAGFEEEPPF